MIEYLDVAQCFCGNILQVNPIGKVLMALSNLLGLTILLLFLLLSVSCSPKFLYTLTASDNSNVKKVFYGKNKDVITFRESQSYNGSFFLYHDFSFDKKLIVYIQGATVLYKNFKIPLRLFGRDYKKDTLYIDGDENIVTAFSARFSFQPGDTLMIKFENFLYDEDGREYQFDPICLIVTPFVRKNYSRRQPKNFGRLLTISLCRIFLMVLLCRKGSCSFSEA